MTVYNDDRDRDELIRKAVVMCLNNPNYHVGFATTTWKSAKMIFDMIYNQVFRLWKSGNAHFRANRTTNRVELLNGGSIAVLAVHPNATGRGGVRYDSIFVDAETWFEYYYILKPMEMTRPRQ